MSAKSLNLKTEKPRPRHSYSFDRDVRRRPARKRTSNEQLAMLLEVFEKTDSPSYDVREDLAAKVGMSNREVQVGFMKIWEKSYLQEIW